MSRNLDPPKHAIIPLAICLGTQLSSDTDIQKLVLTSYYDKVVESVHMKGLFVFLGLSKVVAFWAPGKVGSDMPLHMKHRTCFRKLVSTLLYTQDKLVELGSTYIIAYVFLDLVHCAPYITWVGSVVCRTSASKFVRGVC